VIRSSTLRLGLCLGHVTAVFGFAVPPITGAVVHLAGGIDPNLAGATGSRSGTLACCGCRLGRRVDRARCGRGGTPRLHATMTPTGAGTLRAGEGRAILAGGGDCGRVLRVDHAHGQEEPCDQGEGQQGFADLSRSFEQCRPSISTRENGFRNSRSRSRRLLAGVSGSGTGQRV
jgi:hypothetical protein